MKYAKITNGIVAQIQPNIQDGFIQVGNDVVCGMVTVDNITFTTPPKTAEQLVNENNQSIYSQISALELSLFRPFRELQAVATTEDDKVLAQIRVDDVEAQIQTLRGQLQ